MSASFEKKSTDTSPQEIAPSTTPTGETPLTDTALSPLLPDEKRELQRGLGTPSGAYSLLKSVITPTSSSPSPSLPGGGLVANAAMAALQDATTTSEGERQEIARLQGVINEKEAKLRQVKASKNGTAAEALDLQSDLATATADIQSVDGRVT
jgi:hypothetical protein